MQVSFRLPFVITHPHSSSLSSLASTVISLFGVILIARPSAFWETSGRLDSGVPLPGSGSRTGWGDKVYDPDTGKLVEFDSQAQRMASVGFALMGVCGASSACE